MFSADTPKVGYVVKRYPRYSETFIVNEILAHEKAGLDLEIFALHPPVDSHFQPDIARVFAPVTYLADQAKITDFWEDLVTVMVGMPGNWSEFDGFRGEPVRHVHQALQLAWIIRARGLTHLHAHFATSAASVARLAARLAHIPFTFTAHAKDIFHESVKEEDLRRKLRDASAVVTVSDYNLDFLKSAYGEVAARITRIYNGLDLDHFPFSLPTERPRRILAVGRLVEKKGFGDLIEACALLDRQGVAFDCRIVGSGELETALRARIDDYNLGHRVTMMGPRSQNEIIGLFREAGVFAAPCVIGRDGNRDGLPTVLLESMALGTPCVSTDVTGIPEILHDEDTGLMVPRHDARALAHALQRLLDDGALRIRLARRARRLIENQFDIHRNAATLRALFTPRMAWGDYLPNDRILQEEGI